MMTTRSSKQHRNRPPLRLIAILAGLALLALSLTVAGCKRTVNGPNQPVLVKKPPRNGGPTAKLNGPGLRGKTPTKRLGKLTVDLSKASLKGVGIRIGKPTRHKRLTVYPMMLTQPGLPIKPLTIDEAFKIKKIRVTEQGSGSVPVISLEKSTTQMVFVMTGEMFIGAKQDRISKHDVLLSNRTGLYRIPVYCVEQGRWNGKNHNFRSGNSIGTNKLRRVVAKKGTQSRVWREVRKKTGQLNARTRTSTMLASYRSQLWKKESPAYLAAMKKFAAQNPDASGVLVVIDGAVASVDLFANPTLFGKMWGKLLKSLVLDAIDPHFKESAFTENEVRQFVDRLKVARFKRIKNPGIGREYLIEDAELSGTVLATGAGIIHLSLFPDKNRGKTTRQFERQNKIRQRRRPPRLLNTNEGSLNIPRINKIKYRRQYKGTKQKIRRYNKKSF